MSQELYIFPTKNKKPLTKHGLYDARVESTWTGKESDQWGAPCGEINGFFVIDVDAKSGGLESASEIDWGDTLIIDTPGGGYHVYYLYEEKVSTLKNAVSVLPGIDIRTNGGYIVLYGAVDYSKISAVPDHVYSLLFSSKSVFKKNSTLDSKNGSSVHEVLEGGRNAYLTKVAGRLQRLGVLTLASLNEVNERDCNPPLEEVEVETIFNSVSRYIPESTPDEDEEPEKKIIWAADMVADMFEFLRDKGKSLGEPTGIDTLDILLGGGRRLGEVTATMAEAKTGKNTWWHFQQVPLLERGLAIGYASRELSPETEVLPNLLTLKLKKSIYSHPVSEEEVMRAIKDWKLAFAPGYGAFQGNALFDWMDECLLHGIRFFFIDHLHYCLNDSEDFKLISEFGRKLKTYAKTNMVHIDLIIQPKNRPYIKVGDKLVPQELDIGLLRGGANLGQVIDSLITLDRIRGDDGELLDITKVELKRVRSKLARPGKFFIEYQREDMSFKETSDPTGEDVPKIKEYKSKKSLSASAPAGYSNSKNGSFFDLKRSVDKMLKEIKQDE